MVRKKKKQRLSKIEGVALTGSVSEWDKLPARIRTLVKNNGLMRLSQIRNQIAADAGLPMPKIFIAPYCYVSPDNRAVVTGFAKPMLCEEAKDSYVFAAVLSAATIFAVKDDTILRKLICHEFGHCFYYIKQGILKTNFGKSEARIETKGEDWPTFEEECRRDREAMIDPREWFGQWDIEHFGYAEDGILDESSEKLINDWIDRNLPVRILSRKFETEGIMCVEDEVMEHVCKLDRPK